MNRSTANDPFAILGTSRYAEDAEIRARYLELVRQYPPDTEPDRFREIRSAYEAARDPLLIAAHLLAPPDEKALEWSAVLEAQEGNPPRLTPAFILSLGNRHAEEAGASPTAAESMTASS